MTTAAHTASGMERDLTGRDGQHFELTTARCMHGKPKMLTACAGARCQRWRHADRLVLPVTGDLFAALSPCDAVTSELLSQEADKYHK